MSGGTNRGAPRHRPGRALLLVAAGTALTTLAGVAACQARPDGDFRPPAVASASPSSPPVSPAASPPPVSEPEPPVRLTVPALRLDAPVDAVGVDDRTGDFAVPASVDRVGWYRFGPGFSATTGSIVLAGHVDSAAEGEGAFFRLGSLRTGDVITLAGRQESTRTFRVVARERYRKTAVPLDRYFARDGAARLTLITCGGPFDSRTRHYRDNVVVTAVPDP